MRIISQSRLISLNFDNIGIFIDGSVICTKIDGKSVPLGTYESEDRAREVFDDLHIQCDFVGEKYCSSYKLPDK